MFYLFGDWDEHNFTLIASAIIGFFFFICCSIFSITLASFSLSSIIEEANSVHAFSDCLDYEELPICICGTCLAIQTLHPVRLLLAFNLSIIRNPNLSYGVLHDSFFRKKDGQLCCAQDDVNATYSGTYLHWQDYIGTIRNQRPLYGVFYYSFFQKEKMDSLCCTRMTAT